LEALLSAFLVFEGVRERRFRREKKPREPRYLVRVASVEPFRLLGEGVYDLFGLSLMGFLQHRGDDLLYPPRHLPAYTLLLGRGAVTLGGEELAAKADIGKNTVNRMERNLTEPHMSTLRKLAQALGVEPHELLEGDDDG
jgi:transcriptional regulator with XRE-family HTH domain